MAQPPPYGDWQDPHQQPTEMAYPAASYSTPAASYSTPAAPYSTPAAPPGYGYPVYPYPAVAPTNGMAVASLVCSLAGLAVGVSAPVGAILGHVARRQIRERGEQGDGMALAGIIVGWVLTGLYAMCCVGYLSLIGFAFSQDPSSF
jgi:hypothetical protein